MASDKYDRQLIVTLPQTELLLGFNNTYKVMTLCLTVQAQVKLLHPITPPMHPNNLENIRLYRFSVVYRYTYSSLRFISVTR